MKKLLMALVLAIVICLQSGVSMAATEDMAKIDYIEVKELGLNLIKVEVLKVFMDKIMHHLQLLFTMIKAI